MNKLYRISIALGLAPLVVGISTFALWFYTKSELLEVVGLFIIIFGLVSVIVAAFCLIMYLVRGSLEKIPFKTLLKKGLLSGTIIISNFLVCHFIIASVITLPANNNQDKIVHIIYVTQISNILLKDEQGQSSETMNLYLRIIIQGQLDGRATICISGNGPTKDKYEIGPGKINFGLFQDWYNQECLVEYQPLDVKSGGLIIRYALL
jgi:hypothetical protein